MKMHYLMYKRQVQHSFLSISPRLFLYCWPIFELMFKINYLVTVIHHF